MARKKTSSELKLSLALQGGGAHGAFGWGVLDRLLEEEDIRLEAITATSAGAMNGAVLLYGLISGGRETAKELLQTFWQKISTAASMLPLQPTMIDRFMGTTNVSYSPTFMWMDMMTRMFSPNQYNLLDLNPLRDIVEEIVDFEVIRSNKDYQLFVNATNVRTGKIKLFETQEITIDMVMASACLPFLFKTVHIDGEPYWDGGYSGNPAIYPLFYHCAGNDVLIVQINPLTVEEVPMTAVEILDRVNEISFNTTLMREMRAIHFVKKLLAEHSISDKRYKDMRVHLVEAEQLMNDMGTASKLNADWGFLQHLHDIGYQAMEDWLAEHKDSLGKHSTIPIEEVYL